MFKFMKKSIDLYAPVIGRSVDLKMVPDKMFANKMLGDGIAFIFETSVVYAPCNGEITMIASTKHALGIQTSNGTEIMIHIGIDTVNYGGEGFEVLVNAHDKVKRGQALVKLNLQFFKEKDVNLITPMIIVSKNSKLHLEKSGEVTLDTLVMNVQ